MTDLAELATLIDQAAPNLQGVTNRTPLHRIARLSETTGARIWVKREDLQPVRSYKLRGAYTLMSQLSRAEKEAGVICASAGNHGQGVAWSCAKLGINAKIFVPSTTPRQKRDRMRKLGGDYVELVVTGNTYDEAAGEAKALAAQTGATLVPAFDDLRTATGQGTVAAEIVQQLGRAPDVVLVPVGGGGMLSGIGAWFRTHHPETRIIGVEPAGAACMAAAMAAGAPIELDRIDTFVDGAAVRRAGDLTFELVHQIDPELVAVPEGQVCAEMLELYATDGIIAEPAGALATSSIITESVDVGVRLEPGTDVVAILSGGNNDVSRYAEIVERALIHQGRKHYLLVSFPQEPGALRTFLDEVLGPDDDITYFEYVKRSNRESGPALVGIELGDPFSFDALMERLDNSAVNAEVIAPDSEMLRFMM